MSGDYFFVNPSFVSGLARVLDIGATFDSGSYLISAMPAEADARAASADLNAVLSDFNAALVEYEQEQTAQAA